MSIPKSGTHLIASLLVRCGYLGFGVGAMGPEEERRARIATLMERDLLRGLAQEFPPFTHEQLLSCLVAEMQTRVLSPHAASRLWSPKEFPRVAARLAATRTDALFDADVALIVHELWFDDACRSFRDEWATTGRPKLVFNYRDPRDQLISMVHFLRDSLLGGGLNALYGPILRRLETLQEQVSYAIAAPTFPMRDVYRRNAWMLDHPEVLKVRFEDLVGAQGGGSDELRDHVVRRTGEFLNFNVDVESVTAQLFGGTRTFRAGTRDGWKAVFTEAHRDAFDRAFGDVLSLYGYGWD